MKCLHPTGLMATRRELLKAVAAVSAVAAMPRTAFSAGVQLTLSRGRWSDTRTGVSEGQHRGRSLDAATPFFGGI